MNWFSRQCFAILCLSEKYWKSRIWHHLIFITALDHYAIRGVTHNIPLLRDILTEPTFLSGTFTTNYLNEVYPEGFKGYQLTKVNVYALLLKKGQFCLA